MSNRMSESGLTRSAAVSAIFISASFASSSAFADCAVSGSAPVTVTCSGTFTTTNTANATTPNPDTTDRIQTFSDSVSATVSSGAVITGAGLGPSSTLSGSTVSLTNNGSITATGVTAVTVQGSGAAFALSYSGSGSITGSGAAGALQVAGAGSGTTAVTVSGTSVIKSQASGGVFNAFGIDTTGTSGTVNVTVLNGGGRSGRQRHPIRRHRLQHADQFRHRGNQFGHHPRRRRDQRRFSQ